MQGEACAPLYSVTRRRKAVLAMQAEGLNGFGTQGSKFAHVRVAHGGRAARKAPIHTRQCGVRGQASRGAG